MNDNITKKVIACDLDGTLARSKSVLEQSMADTISKVLDKYMFAVISGGAFPQFQKQFISRLSFSPERMKNLYLFPTNGSVCYVFNVSSNEWDKLYDEPLTPQEKEKIMSAFSLALSESGVNLGESYGEIIEDRGGQITFSACGQEAPIEVKEKWDPDQEKRRKIAKILIREIPEFEVKIGGTTSIDVTHKGINKAYAITKIFEHLKVTKEEVLFIGDAIFPGGNDYAAKETGVDCVKVSGPDEAQGVLKSYL